MNKRRRAFEAVREAVAPDILAKCHWCGITFRCNAEEEVRCSACNTTIVLEETLEETPEEGER